MILRRLPTGGAWRIERGIDAFAIVVIASVALALAGLTWRLTGYTGEPPVAAPASSSGRSTAADPGAAIALAPFGTAMAVSQGANDTSIRLKGILLAVPASASSALIAGSDGKVANYAIGAAVGGGVIEAIEADQVIVRTPGGLQVLGFVPAAGGATLASSSNSASGTNTSSRPVPVTGKPVAPTGADAIRALIPQAAQNGGAAAMRPKPGAAAATSTAAAPAGGFRIVDTAAPALFAAGLQVGDIVEQFNGTPVTGNLNERELLTRAAQAGSAQLVVLRNGQRVSLTVAMH